jgi:hypothetical protein
VFNEFKRLFSLAMINPRVIIWTNTVEALFQRLKIIIGNRILACLEISLIKEAGLIFIGGPGVNRTPRIMGFFDKSADRGQTRD